MKKPPKKIITVLVICLACLTAAGSAYAAHKNRFRHLKFEDIDNIKIYSLYHFDDGMHTAILRGSDALIAYELLNDIVLKGFGSKQYQKYTSISTIMYRIELNNGTAIDVSGSSPFYIIDRETGYWGNRTLCHALASFHADMDTKYFPKAE